MDVIVLCMTVVGGLLALTAAALLFPRWRRNRYRFSMRTMLIVFLFAGCVMFTVQRFVAPVVQHRWAIQRIYLAGGDVDFLADVEKFGVHYDPPKHGENHWRDVSSINVSGDRQAAAVAEHLTRLPEVDQVRLFFIGDAGLATICEAKSGPSLNELSLHESRLSGAGLSKLAKLAGVRRVFINTCAIDDAGLTYFASMPNLQHLWLLEEGAPANPARFTEKGLAEIGRLKNLDSLRFNNLKITDESARRRVGSAITRPQAIEEASYRLLPNL